MSRLIDLRNKKIGRLTVLKRDLSINDNRTRWICQCECGNKKTVRADTLRNKRTNSCGCLQRDLLVKRKPRKIHGKSGKRLYTTFQNMKKRCYDKNHINFNDYGGKGVKVCDDWVDNFEGFYDWSMSNGYKYNLTIDRINNEKGYSPNNCRFITHREQQNNRKNNVLVSFEGETKTISQWADSLNISYSALQTRLKRGWSIDKALNTPVRKGDYKRNA